MPSAVDISQLSESQLRDYALQMQAALAEREVSIQQLENEKDAQLQERDAAIERLKIEKEHLTHEIAILRRHRFGKRSESKSRSPQQSLLDDLVDEDIAGIETELEALAEPDTQARPRSKPRRQPLPPQLPRTEIHHDPESTTCECGCQLIRIGEDISEKLDYAPGQFSVERHIRSKWACRQCETVTQAPVAPHIIDKGIPTTNLLAQVLISKYADHLPLYRQEQIYARAGVELPRSTLADWVGRCGVELTPLIERLRACLLGHAVLHADETPVPMLSPGKKKTHRAYIWAYATPHAAPIQAVVYDFQPTRSGQACRDFLADWQGKLVCDDYQGYKAGFAGGIIEIGCWGHGRRKFFDLSEQGDSPIADQALQYIGMLYDVEREIADKPPDERQRIRESRSRPIVEKLREWLIHQRAGLTDGTRTARAIDYSLKRWEALERYLDDGAVPIDNNWIENQIRPWALGRKNWLFAGSVRSGQRAANVVSLIQSAKINGLDPQAYLRDVLARLPSTKYSDIDSLLPHNWTSPIKV
ncbi:MAG: IS66 family transposase [Pseudomonadota bacterium]